MSVLRREGDEGGRSARFTPAVLYRGARLYYEEDRTQAEIASLLGISRATVSRLLAEARATGIVRIEVRDPAAGELEGLASAIAARLGLRRVLLTPSVLGVGTGAVLAPAVTRLLEEAELRPGDALLVSSGATMLEISREELLPLPGVLVAPNVGGQDEPEGYYQTNEIARRLAVNAGATPVLLHAPVQPGGELYQLLLGEPGVRRVLELWQRARCALLGIGLPPRLRTSTPTVMRNAGADLYEAVGDICVRPYDASGTPIPYPGSDRMLAMELEDLCRIPHAIGVAVGAGKAEAISAAARAGYINRLVTDASTAEAILALDPVAPAGREA